MSIRLYKIGNYFFKKKNMILSRLLYSLCLFNYELKNDAIIGITNSLVFQKKYKRAIRILEKEVNKGNKALRFQLAYIYILYSEIEKAIETYNEMLNSAVLLNAEIDHRIVANLVEAYNSRSLYDKAIDIIQRFVEGKDLSGVENQLFHNVGNTFLALKEHDKAIEYYYKALDESDPENYKILYNIACCYYGKGEHSKAISLYEEAIEPLKDRAEIGKINFAIGCSYKKLGDIKRAKDYFIMAKNDGYSQADEALKEVS